MLEGLESVDWKRLHHAYGSAEDVPEQLRALATATNENCDKVIWPLFGNIYHQGSLWEASCYAVPFLCEIVDEPSVECRSQVLDLLLHVALGDIWRADETLPFDPTKYFQDAQDITTADYNELIRVWYEIDGEGDGISDERLDKLGAAWHRDSYSALSNQASLLLKWAQDDDSDVTKIAVVAIAWFPNIHECALPLLIKILRSDSDALLKASTNLTLAYLTLKSSQEVKEALQCQISGSVPLPQRLTAAIAEAVLFSDEVSEESLKILIEADSQRAELDAISRDCQAIPFRRSLMGLRALALQRLQL